MFKNYKPPFYNAKAQELNWLNNTVQTHDMICSCDDPWTHLGYILAKKNNQKCLPSTSKDGGTADQGTQTDTEDKDILDTVDLENFFSEDFGEEDSG